MSKIRNRVTPFLKRRPVLYRFGAGVYFTLQTVHLKELLVGTKAREKEWAARHLHEGNDWNDTRHVGEDDEWVMGYWDSQRHSHRSLLLEKISSCSPNRVLEVGCNCGPNLYLIARKFPDMEIRGIDINPRAVEKGRELFASEGISNVTLSVGKADELGQFQEGSFDVVFTDAVLIYIGRDKIKKVVQEMLRVSRHALILVERHFFGTRGNEADILGVYRYGCWERDYVRLLKQFVPGDRISITKITEDSWPDRRWAETGAIVEVVI